LTEPTYPACIRNWATGTALAALAVAVLPLTATSALAADDDGRPTNVRVPDKDKAKDAPTLIGVARELIKDTENRPLPPPPPPPLPEVRDATVEQSGALYGPPAPKVEKGELSNVDWTQAPVIVPPALEEAVNLVTTNYPSALAGRAALRAAHSDVRAAQWLRFPSVSGNLSYLDASGSPEPQVAVEMPLWAGGRIDANIRRARASESASSAEYIETLLNLALTTSNTYFEVARLTQSEQLLAESLEVHNQLVETMQRRVGQEVSPIADLELARSRAAQIEQQYTVTKSQRNTALRVLAELIADPAFDLGPIPYYDPEYDLDRRDILEDQAVAFSPGLRRLRSEADVAREEVSVRKSQILPQLNAQYSYDEVFGSRVGVVVRAQSTGGLSQVSEVNSARLRVQSALENIRTTEQQLRRDIASDVIQYEAAKRRAAISRDATDTAARVSASYMRQFIAGRRSWLDVMNALREAVTAQLGRADAEVNVMSSASRLLLRSGRWRPVFDDDDVETFAERKRERIPIDDDGVEDMKDELEAATVPSARDATE
jgi:adhesin transport system outer membrane protein